MTLVCFLRSDTLSTTICADRRQSLYIDNRTTKASRWIDRQFNGAISEDFLSSFLDADFIDLIRCRTSDKHSSHLL